MENIKMTKCISCTKTGIDKVPRGMGKFISSVCETCSIKDIKGCKWGDENKKEYCMQAEMLFELKKLNENNTSAIINLNQTLTSVCAILNDLKIKVKFW